MKVERAQAWIFDVLDVLDVLHGQGNEHRDFKPSNAMVQAGGHEAPA